MNKIFGIIIASDKDDKLDDLTLVRTTASVPFGGRYRCVDFTLSNLVNSNISSVGIVTRYNYASLMDHIRMGRDWDLNRMNGGITVFPPFAQINSKSVFKDKIEAIYGIKSFMQEKVKEEYVVITNSNIISSINYQNILSEHINNNADITMLTYTNKPNSQKKLIVELDDKNKVKSAKISRQASDEDAEIGINAYLMKKSLLLDLIIDNYENGNLDFDKYIIQKNIDKLNIYAHHVVEHCAILDDINTYYNESMALLNKDIRDSLFNGKGGKIYTRIKGSAPTRYESGAKIKNSLIADGCVIAGTVENSILFRGVKVQNGAVIKNSIIMEDGTVEADAVLDYVITDKDVVITKGVELKGISKQITVISKGKRI